MVDSKKLHIKQQPAYNKLINAEVHLQHDNEMIYGKVKKRALNPDGQTNGRYDKNTMLNSIIYEVEFEDGRVNEYSANAITENMITQVDSDGFNLTMMEGIIDYRKNMETAVTKDYIYIVTKRVKTKIW